MLSAHSLETAAPEICLQVSLLCLINWLRTCKFFLSTAYWQCKGFKMRFVRTFISSVLIFAVLLACLALVSNVLPPRLEGDYLRQVYEQILQTPESNLVLTDAMLADLPPQLQRLYRQSGYLGKPLAAYLKMDFEQADYTPSFHQSSILVSSQQTLWADTPLRFNYASGRLALASYESLQSYRSQFGESSQIFARYFQLGAESGLAASKNQLLAWLADSIWLPKVALSGLVSWEEIDPQHLKATVSDGALQVHGVFEFDADGLLTGFFTNETEGFDTEGEWGYLPWVVNLADYNTQSGYFLPSSYTLSWVFPMGRYPYFTSQDLQFHFE